MADRKNKWVQPRHKFVRNLVYPVLVPIILIKYGLKVDKFKNKGRQYFIMLNHQTPMDQFFVGISFSGAVYYVATEDIFSNGFTFRLIKWLIAPIPIKKQLTDFRAFKNCLQVAKEGGTIAIAPEGNRTYSGKTESINPAIIKLARKLNLPVATYRIEGGYGVQPRWSDGTRRGRMHAYVSRVIEPEEYAAMTDEEFLKAITDGIFVNEAQKEASPKGIFRSNRRAEYIERIAYVCPFCGLSEFESKKNTFKCLKCGRTANYGADKRLEGVGFDLPFEYFGDWYDFQNEYINNLDLLAHCEEPLYRDEAKLIEVHLYESKEVLDKAAKLALYGNRITVNEGTDKALSLDFDDVKAASVLGRNKLNIYYKDNVYQFKGGKRFNAVKYVNFYHRYKNITRGDNDGKFLGL